MRPVVGDHSAATAATCGSRARDERGVDELDRDAVGCARAPPGLRGRGISCRAGGDDQLAAAVVRDAVPGRKGVEPIAALDAERAP